MKKLVLSIAVALTVLSGCGVFQRENSTTITAKIRVEPTLLIGCPKLVQINSTEPTYEEVAASYLTTISLYGQCALKQQASISVIKQLANMEQTK